MNATNKKLIGIGVGAVLLVGATAAIASYMTRQSLTPDAEITAQAPPPQKVAAAQPPPQPRCDDKNIVGTIAGGAAGGVIGNQIGKGSGKTAATVGGVVGGAVLGNQFIPTRNVTCRQ